MEVTGSSRKANMLGHEIDNFRRKCVAKGLTHDQVDIFIGDVALYAETAYKEGYERGYAAGSKKRDVIHDTYFRLPAGLMSGTQLPRDLDGICRNRHFVECRFHSECHPDLHPELFENCTFKDCN